MDFSSPVNIWDDTKYFPHHSPHQFCNTFCAPPRYVKCKNTSGALKVLEKKKIDFCKNFKFLQTKFKRKKLEAGFVSAAEQRRIANHPSHKDSCIVYLLVIEKFECINYEAHFLHLFLLNEHSFLAEISDTTLNMPIGLRSRRRFLIFVLQIQMYGSCRTLTPKKNKPNPKPNKPWDHLHHCCKQISPMSCENSLSHSWDLMYEDSPFTVWPCMSIHPDVPTAKYFYSAFSSLPITHIVNRDSWSSFWFLILPPFCPEGLLNLKP